MNIRFIKSAKLQEDWPKDGILEVGIVGRSNSGKSSYINSLAGSSKLAKVSGKPGKTRLLNFFQVSNKYRLVDMPGYGYAGVSGTEQKSWHKMIEDYLNTRENLAGLILIMDIRRKWTDDEQLLVDWVSSKELPVCVLLNKADKVKQGEKVKKKREVKAIEGVERVFVVSAFKKKGISDVDDYIYENWVKACKNG